MKFGVISLSIAVVILFTWNIVRYRNGLKKSTLSHPLIKAGVPDQLEEKDLANLENSKMVSEGSQFGVQYFNEFMHN